MNVKMDHMHAIRMHFALIQTTVMVVFVMMDLMVMDSIVVYYVSREQNHLEEVTRKIHPPIQMLVIPDVWLRRMTLSIASPAGHAPWHMLNNL